MRPTSRPSGDVGRRGSWRRDWSGCVKTPSPQLNIARRLTNTIVDSPFGLVKRLRDAACLLELNLNPHSVGLQLRKGEPRVLVNLAKKVLAINSMQRPT